MWSLCVGMEGDILRKRLRSREGIGGTRFIYLEDCRKLAGRVGKKITDINVVSAP